MQFIYFKIHDALGVKDKMTIYKDFQELWKNKYRGKVTVDLKTNSLFNFLAGRIASSNSFHPGSFAGTVPGISVIGDC